MSDYADFLQEKVHTGADAVGRKDIETSEALDFGEAEPA
jgi:hypothetical protein